MIVSSYTNAGLGTQAGESDKVIEMFYGRAKFLHAPHHHLTVLGWIAITAETVNYGFDHGGGVMAPFICWWVSMLAGAAPPCTHRQAYHSMISSITPLPSPACKNYRVEELRPSIVSIIFISYLNSLNGV